MKSGYREHLQWPGTSSRKKIQAQDAIGNCFSTRTSIGHEDCYEEMVRKRGGREPHCRRALGMQVPKLGDLDFRCFLPRHRKQSSTIRSSGSFGQSQVTPNCALRGPICCTEWLVVTALTATTICISHCSASQSNFLLYSFTTIP